MTLPPLLCHDTRRLLAPVLLAAVAAAVAACATPCTERNSASMTAPTASTADQSVPVTRYSRYTLVELAPTESQRDLLSQIIDVTLPPVFSATVGDALRYVLLRSGYSLCTGPDDINELAALPLPAAHLHLGPTTLRQALELLAGPSWVLEINEGLRRICYAPAPSASAVASETRG